MTDTIDTVDWNLLGTCNLRCLHCYGPSKNVRSLPTEDLLRIIGKMKEMGVVRAVLTGGEPLLTPDIEQIVNALTAADIQIAMSSNGSFVEQYWEMIRIHISSLNIPIDGPTAEIHALSRIDTSTFYTNLNILERCKRDPRCGPKKLRIGTVYSMVTAGHLKAVARLLLPFAQVIATWKIYELIDHEMQPDLRRPILHDAQDFRTEVDALILDADIVDLCPKIMVASASSRDRAYFMLNPFGQVVVPTRIGSMTVEKVIGDFLLDSADDLIQRWSKEVDFNNYEINHARHY